MICLFKKMLKQSLGHVNNIKNLWIPYGARISQFQIKGKVFITQSELKNAQDHVTERTLRITRA
ncbi:MAG: hypothetical protein CME64_06015 [Halobacteriovoraceae bacterium]|nr:hypothetical protein [Halobacteriovoraceae bacterium]|tara:strand:- start:141572 stop:141763 length:192 start_codon:yes stop_codon:yes gene_type:complete